MLFTHNARSWQCLSIQKCLALLLLLCFSIPGVFAQKKTPAVAKKEIPSGQPAWIAMMDDPDVNYYRAVADFNAYWKHRIKPLEENELFETGGKKEQEEALRERKQGRLRNNDAAVKYAYDYKRFLHWKEDAAHLVKADGHLKSVDERIKEWKQEQEFRQKKQHTTENANRN